MTINHFLEEYVNFKEDRRRIGMIRFLEILESNPMEYEDLILECMHSAKYVEQDDGFGTEGADI